MLKLENVRCTIMEKRFCFVVSPIGKPDSPERKQADIFLDLIKDIGELHSLEVKRADEFVGSNDINDDVINKIQNADLCIIDLTGTNPNVMYEFGMRYQTSLPYIVCAKYGTKLPFDTITKRTIFYNDLDSTAEYKKIREQIRKYIEVFESQGYQSTETITSKDLYGMLQTVIEKLDNMNNLSACANNSKNDWASPTSANVDDLLRQLEPSEAFRYAYSTNQIELAEKLLEYCRNQPFEYFFNKLCALSMRGSEKGSKELESCLNDHIDTMPLSQVIEAIGSLVTCYNRHDSETTHMESMERLLEIALSRAQTNRDRAAILNQKQRLLAGANMFEEAEKVAKAATELNDEEPAYFYNYATILKKLGQSSLALDNAKKAVKLSSEEDADCLELLCKLLKESADPANTELFEMYMRKLEQVNPFKARLIRLQ